MDKQEASQRLGMPVAEIVDVRDTDDGPVVTTFDGWQYIVLESSLAFYGNAPKGSSFPVFAPTVAAEEPAVDVDGDGVPDGSAKQVLAWVGDDRERAALALAVEREKEADARSTLVAQLEKLVD